MRTKFWNVHQILSRATPRRRRETGYTSQSRPARVTVIPSTVLARRARREVACKLRIGRRDFFDDLVADHLPRRRIRPRRLSNLGGAVEREARVVDNLFLRVAGMHRLQGEARSRAIEGKKRHIAEQGCGSSGR